MAATRKNFVMRNVKSTGVGAHAIEVCLIVNTPEKQKRIS